MKMISFAKNANELVTLLENQVNEVIVSVKELGRFSETTLKELEEMILIKRKHSSLKLILEWDALNQENKFKKTIEVLNKIPLIEFQAIRLQDPGAIYYVKENYPWLKIQLILETGNHNLVGIKRWQNFLGAQLERIIVSNELSKEYLELYASSINTPIEVLIFGRILLFYSPRSLIAPLEKKNIEKSFIEVVGTSEESPHSGFPIIENQHGTFMFNVKDLSLLENIEELKQIGINDFRIDLRFDNHFLELNNIISKIKNNTDYKASGPRPYVKGFYNVNKTDVIFVKLKNKRIVRVDENYLGVVVDVERDHQLTILTKNPKKNISSLKLKIITPEGKEKKLDRFQFKNSEFNVVDCFENEEIVTVPYVNGVTVKSQVYIDND
jgi:putative protease